MYDAIGIPSGKRWMQSDRWALRARWISVASLPIKICPAYGPVLLFDPASPPRRPAACHVCGSAHKPRVHDVVGAGHRPVLGRKYPVRQIVRDTHPPVVFGPQCLRLQAVVSRGDNFCDRPARISEERCWHQHSAREAAEPKWRQPRWWHVHAF